MREKDLSVVISTLEEEFNIYKEVGGESVPMHCLDVSNGLQKNGKEGRGHGPVQSALRYRASSSQRMELRSSGTTFRFFCEV